MTTQQSDSSSMLKTFCTTGEAADLLSISVGTVQLWVEKGLLEAWKTTGGHRRITRDSIHRLLYMPQVGSETSADSTQPKQCAQRNLRMMVVDDDQDTLRLYAMVIRTWRRPIDLVCIDNAMLALLHMGKILPDLLITDLQMPEIDGFEMLRTIARVPELAQLHIAVVSGLDGTEIKEHGGLPNDIGVLPKPIPFSKLQQMATDVAHARSIW